LIDGIAERIRPGQRREPVLAAWGFTFDGRKALLHLMAGSKEDAETVSAFFQDMRADSDEAGHDSDLKPAAVPI
jgi:putative transposase